jgi:hypothetical protein
MTKKLILHIGTEKTGTTSIQDFLSENKAELESQGVFIPQSPCGSVSAPNHRRLATACFNNGNTDDSFVDFNIKNLEEWRIATFKEIKSELVSSSISTHILSSEHFSSRLTSKSEISRLYDFLKEIYSEIKIVVYFRRQDEYAVSLYSTYLKSGGVSKKILPVSAGASRYDYYDICKKWEGVFGSNTIDVRIFDRKVLRDGNVVSDFCHISGIDETNTKEGAQESNPSITPLAQEILRGFNLLSEEKEMNYKVKENLVKYLETNYKGQPRLPQRDFLIKWFDAFSDSNELLFNEYVDSNIKFSEDFSKYPDQWINVLFSTKEILDVMVGFSNYTSEDKESL